MSEGRIQFDYEGSMVSIAGNVSDEEAFQIVDAIRRQRTPQNIGALTWIKVRGATGPILSLADG